MEGSVEVWVVQEQMDDWMDEAYFLCSFIGFKQDQ